jgi:hypothetical protein
MLSRVACNANAVFRSSFNRCAEADIAAVLPWVIHDRVEPANGPAISAVP